MADRGGLSAQGLMRKDRRTKVACSPRESGQFRRLRERPETRRESERGLRHRRNDWLQEARKRALHHEGRLPAIESAEETSLFHAARRRLVDHRPEDAEFLDRIDELVKIDRLYDIGVHPEAVASHHVLFLMR